MGMRVGVLGGTADGGTNTHMAFATGFAQRAALVLGIAELTDGCQSIRTQTPNLTTGKFNTDEIFFFVLDEGGGTSGADDLTTFAGSDLEIVDGQTNGDLGKR